MSDSVIMRIFISILCLTIFPSLLSVAYADNADSINPVVVKLDKAQRLSVTGDTLATKRVVYVGETHNAYQDHLVQLDLLKQLHHTNPDLAIGAEWFQTPYQAYLDDYIAGRISEKEMLEQTEYFSRWRFDYRLYRPIMNYAREHTIPVIALNAPAELIKAVSSKGLDDLPENFKTQLPSSYDFSNKAYEEELQDVYKMHPESDRNFKWFYESQLTWDETMADSVADYLKANPQKRMIVFAGRGHISHGYGIPSRVSRRIQVEDATVLTHRGEVFDLNVADFLVFAKEVRLLDQGKLGALIDADEEGVKIAGFTSNSAAQKAGLKKDDVITSVDGQLVTSYTDLKYSIMDKEVGDRVEVTYQRKPLFFKIREKTIAFDLGSAQISHYYPIHKNNKQ